MARTIPQSSQVPDRDRQEAAQELGSDGAPETPRGTLSRGSLGLRLTSSQWLLLGIAVVGLVALVSIVAGGSGMEFPAVYQDAKVDSPEDVGRKIGSYIDRGVTWMTRKGEWLFDAIKTAVLYVLLKLEYALLWIPWPASVAAVALVSWRLAGWKVALFSLLALLSIGFVGLWDSAMETLSLVVTSVALAVAIGVPLGVIGARSNLADSLMRPVLDGMQTMPAFVYLVPAIMFFSLGNVPAVIATVLYALPPAIRLTNLGIRQVSPETLEAARSFGTTPMQLLLKVQIPMALPTIMAGINQTTMMALAMVVIGAMVSAGGLGEDVLRGMGRQELGNAALGGLGIVFIAIIIDRITQALASGQQQALEGSSR